MDDFAYTMNDLAEVTVCSSPGLAGQKAFISPKAFDIFKEQGIPFVPSRPHFPNSGVYVVEHLKEFNAERKREIELNGDLDGTKARSERLKQEREEIKIRREKLDLEKASGDFIHLEEACSIVGEIASVIINRMDRIPGLIEPYIPQGLAQELKDDCMSKIRDQINDSKREIGNAVKEIREGRKEDD